MSGASIAAEVALALREAGAELGNGLPFLATLTRAAAQQNPWDVPGQPVTYQVAVVVSMYQARQVDGTLIQVQDRLVSIEAAGVEPSVADTLTIGGQVYNVISVKPLAPAGVAVMYEVQCRAQ